MAGYNGEAGRSLNENIYCELQNKTRTLTGPNRREDSLEFRCECRGSERLARGVLMANVKGPRSASLLPGTACPRVLLTGKPLLTAPYAFQILELDIQLSRRPSGIHTQNSRSERLRPHHPTPSGALPTRGYGTCSHQAPTRNRACFSLPTESAPSSPQGVSEFAPTPIPLRLT